MDEYFAAAPLGNSRVLCVGGITRAEMEASGDAGHVVDGTGYYLFVADESEPKKPIELLGALLSPSHAARLATLLNTGMMGEPDSL